MNVRPFVTFQVDCAAKNFTLHVNPTDTDTPPGMVKAVDAFNNPGHIQNGMSFYTYDHDNPSQCAYTRKGYIDAFRLEH